MANGATVSVAKQHSLLLCANPQNRMSEEELGPVAFELAPDVQPGKRLVYRHDSLSVGTDYGKLSAFMGTLWPQI